MKPITTFTRASQPPLRGIFFRYCGKQRQQEKRQCQVPLAKTTMPSSGRAPPPCTDAASSVPMNGPTQANDASAKVRPISSVPSVPPCSDF